MHTHARTHTHMHTHSLTHSLTHTHIHTLTRTHALTHTHTHTLTRTHARTHTLTRTHTLARSHTHARAHTHSHAHTHSLARTRTHARAHTHTHARTHTHTNTFVSRSKNMPLSQLTLPPQLASIQGRVHRQPNVHFRHGCLRCPASHKPFLLFLSRKHACISSSSSSRRVSEAGALTFDLWSGGARMRWISSDSGC